METKDETPAWCWPWGHQWGKWQDLSQVQKRGVRHNNVLSLGVEQCRRCTKCNKLQLRTVWS